MTRIRDKLSLLTTNRKGFTLIELLIVIVIIGILAGVLIAIIDPAAQQNRARDANVRSTMNKTALEINGFVAAFGVIPDETEVLEGLNNAVDANAATGVTPFGAVTCATADQADCLFHFQNQPLSANCSANGWGGSATPGNQCFYRYCGNLDDDLTNAAVAGCDYITGTTINSRFRIFARAWGSTNVFVYNSDDSISYLCDGAGANCNAL